MVVKGHSQCLLQVRVNHLVDATASRGLLQSAKASSALQCCGYRLIVMKLHEAERSQSKGLLNKVLSPEMSGTPLQTIKSKCLNLELNISQTVEASSHTLGS